MDYFIHYFALDFTCMQLLFSSLSCNTKIHLLWSPAPVPKEFSNSSSGSNLHESMMQTLAEVPLYSKASCIKTLHDYVGSFDAVYM